MRIVALGGGTGLPVLLRGLKERLFPAEWRGLPARGREHLTAIVTVADDGGSSGRLRRAYGVLPPGDIRNCLLALSDGDATLSAIFGFRFDGQEGVAGHSLGNLILAALAQLDGHFPRAVERAGQILSARGRVLPSTAEAVCLVAEFTDGTRAEGESQIAAARRPIRRVRLEPENARAVAEACEAMALADMVVIGPGSLYTSLIPVLLVRDLAEALAASRARTLIVMNLMTQPGETDGYTAADHVNALRRHVDGVAFDDVLINATPIQHDRASAYAASGAHAVVPDLHELRRMGCRVWCRDLVAPADHVRHDPEKLADAVLEVGASAPADGVGAVRDMAVP
jgi:uncharacterized cofD-like protein